MKKKIHEIWKNPYIGNKVMAQQGLLASGSYLLKMIHWWANLDHASEALESRFLDPVIKDRLCDEARSFLKLTGDERLLSAFKLGRLCQINSFILEEVKANKNKATGSRKKKWAQELAVSLLRPDPKKDFHRLWKTIPEHSHRGQETYDGYEVTRDGDVLVAHRPDGGMETLAKETFRTKYLTEARAAQSRRGQ